MTYSETYSETKMAKTVKMVERQGMPAESSIFSG
jgi:hypothetical protein